CSYTPLFRSPWPDEPGVGGVVAGAATHHQAHLAGPGAVLADEPGGVRYPSHVPGVGGGEAVDDVRFEVGGIVVDMGHGVPPSSRPRRERAASARPRATWSPRSSAPPAGG